MTGYLINFSVYTLAMVGVIFGAVFVFKTFSGRCLSKKSKLINIEDAMNLSPRKNLYVIKAGEERFLIAADTDRTALISKLNSNPKEQTKPDRDDKSLNLKSFDGVESISEFTSVIDFPSGNKNKKPMMKELARKLSAL